MATPVQSASAIAHTTVPANTTLAKSVSAIFSSSNTAGNTIVVLVFLNQSGAGVGNNSPSVTDTRGNTYTQGVNHPPGGSNNGAGCWMYYATGIAAGANTVTFGFNAEGGFVASNFEYSVAVTEYSGMPSPTLQASANVSIFGSAGNSPSVLTITDSHGASVSVTIQSPGPPGADGIGTINTGALLVDFLSGTTDYLIAGALANFNTLLLPTTAGGYATFTQETLASDATNSYYGYYWDGPHEIPNTAQPQIFVVT